MMWLPDLPDAPPHAAQAILVAQNSVANITTKNRTMGYCALIYYPEEDVTGADNGLSPVNAALSFLFSREPDLKHLSPDDRRALLSNWEGSAKTTLIKGPKNGAMASLNGRIYDDVDGAFYFKPPVGDFSKQNMTVLVEVGPYKITQQITIHRRVHGTGPKDIQEVCGIKGKHYPIAQTAPSFGGLSFNASDSGWTYRFATSGFDTGSFGVQFVSLQGSAIGVSHGSGLSASISVNTTADSDGRFFDSTPLSNEISSPPPSATSAKPARSQAKLMQS